MTIRTVLHNRKTTSLVTVAAIIILAPFGYGLIRPVAGFGSSETPTFLDMPDEQYQECVRETTYMRYRHMDLLKQTREEVIRDGIRGEITLSGCRDCHTSRERFCNQCHEAAGLSVDCFGCHYFPEPGDEIQEAESEAQDG